MLGIIPLGDNSTHANDLLPHTLSIQVSDSKEGPDSDFQKHIKDAEILITTPFHPGYLTKELMATAKNLKVGLAARSRTSTSTACVQDAQLTCDFIFLFDLPPPPPSSSSSVSPLVSALITST